MQVDSFTPAHSAFGLPIYVALLSAGSIQRACHDSLPWLISVSLDASSTGRGVVNYRMLNPFLLHTQQVEAGCGRGRSESDWHLLEVIDSAESGVHQSEFPSCEHCGKERIRFVHILEHNSARESRRVGSECSQLLTSNSVMARHLERLARSTAARKARFLRSARWEMLAGGNVCGLYKRHEIFLRRITEDIFDVSINGTYRIKGSVGLHAAKMAAYDWIM